MYLSKSSKLFLLTLARKSIEHFLNHKKYLTLQEVLPDDLRFNSGCFVTLHSEGNLRGCIGTFNFNDNICENVMSMAVKSAVDDSRFKPLKINEISNIEVEISVLTPLEKVFSRDDIIAGLDGLYIVMGYFTGVLLPQVARENNWDVETFVSYTCLKAGLPSDTWKKYSWKNSEFHVYKFQALVFSESDFVV
mgnify:CR=1 FL=1|jgi:AmmeMemoRadiSam system protein A